MIEATKDWQSRLLWQEELSWELLEAWAYIVIFTQTSITTQTKREESCQSSSVPRPSLWAWLILRPKSWTKSKQKFSSLLFTVTSTALPWDFYFFKLTQPLTVSTVHFLYTVTEQGGKPERILYPLPYCLRNPYSNLKSENSQDYAYKPQWNCTFMNSASGQGWNIYSKGLILSTHYRYCPFRC
jgi:hypothetical protein